MYRKAREVRENKIEMVAMAGVFEIWMKKKKKKKKKIN